MSTFGFADAHSTLIGYEHGLDADSARSHAQDLADERGEAIEYWIDGSDPDEPSLVAHPKVRS